MRLPLPGKYYYEALLLAHENGVVGDPDLDPHGPCTRGEIVTCPVNSAGGDGVKSVTSLYPKVRFHDLRHTFATLALQNGVDIKTVSGMLGHFSAGFTLDTYAHITSASQRQAAQIMGNVLSCSL